MHPSPGKSCKKFDGMLSQLRIFVVVAIAVPSRNVVFDVFSYCFTFADVPYDAIMETFLPAEFYAVSPREHSDRLFKAAYRYAES